MLLVLLSLIACPRPSTLEEALDVRPPLDLPPQTHPLDAVSVPDLPMWTNKYAKTRDDFGRFFSMAALMDEYGLSRLQSIELQNHYRDLHRADPDGREVDQFAEALRRVQAKEFESGIDPVRIQNAPFVVVFDLDDTLYDQYAPAIDGDTCTPMSRETEKGTKTIYMAPGWQSIIKTIRELDGEVVLFSANVDAPTRLNLKHIDLAGKPLLGHPDIAGVMTNSYLTLQEKSAGRPVSEPSKDLRFFDEELRKVIIVDDNPTRLFQPANTRLFRKLHAEDLCAADPDAKQRAAMLSAMPTVEREIRESVTSMSDLHIDFATAYLPYTQIGRVAVQALVDGTEMPFEEAVLYLRQHPELADLRF